MLHDTGLGIPLEDQDMIFSEFSRSERSVQLGYKGLGLGLAICKRLVEMHDGSMGVQSAGKVGDGSTFYFTLPTVQPPGQELNNADQSTLDEMVVQVKSDESESTRTDRQAFTILVVDNEPNTLELHTRIVQSHSLSNRVLQAHNGEEALAILEEESIDLVLLDLQMPEMDGFEVLEKMRAIEQMQKIPVIVVTGQVLTEAEMARLNRGVASILGKGVFGLDETVAHIQLALEHKHRLSQESQRLVRKAMASSLKNMPNRLTYRYRKHVSIAKII